MKVKLEKRFRMKSGKISLLILAISFLLASCNPATPKPTQLADLRETPLPAATLSSEELVQTLTAMPSNQPESSPMPPQVTPSVKADWENATAANPITDPQEISQIFDDLHQRYMAQIDRPGWYRSYSQSLEDVSWLHVYDVDGWKIDATMHYFDRSEEGNPIPETILCLDGDYGIVKREDYHSGEYTFYSEAELNNLRPYYGSLPWLQQKMPEKSWDNLAYFLGHNRIGSENLQAMKSAVLDPYDAIYPNAKKDIYLYAWVDELESLPVLVLQVHTLYSGELPKILIDEPVQIEDNFTYFSLENGGAIAERLELRFQNLDYHISPYYPIGFHLLTYFEELSSRDQTIFDQTCQKLAEFRQNP
jgi:hypothetical protein